MSLGNLTRLPHSLGESVFLGNGLTLRTCTTSDFSTVHWTLAVRHNALKKASSAPLDESALRKVALEALARDSWHPPLLDAVKVDVEGARCVLRNVRVRPTDTRWAPAGRLTLLGDSGTPPFSLWPQRLVCSRPLFG